MASAVSVTIRPLRGPPFPAGDSGGSIMNSFSLTGLTRMLISDCTSRMEFATTNGSSRVPPGNLAFSALIISGDWPALSVTRS